LLDRAGALARQLRAPLAVLTFDPLPIAVLRPDLAPPRVQTLGDRVRCLGEAGVDHVIVETFDTTLAAMPPDLFARAIVGCVDPSAFVLGWDFRYGRGRAGDPATLSAVTGVPVEIFGPWLEADSPASSSRIRSAVIEGDVAGAAALLGRPHEVVGVVVTGAALGRTIGFPTANVRTETELLPRDGVYAVTLSVGSGRPLPAVANLGVRPTVTGSGERRLEVHVLDWAGELVGAHVRVAFVARLRDERRFDGLPALVAQIQADAAAARAIFAP
jgi:riboflavin kinase/FMN adenylyltransferase